jgi:hypothetical protein
MKQTMQPRASDAADRQALRRRVKQFYARFNKTDWDRCYALVDPQLRRHGKVNRGVYTHSLAVFKEAYGSVRLWLTRLSLHMGGAPRHGDKRPFAFVYVIWQDDAHEYHMFRERWVKDDSRWFTRVAGLVPNKRRQ